MHLEVYQNVLIICCICVFIFLMVSLFSSQRSVSIYHRYRYISPKLYLTEMFRFTFLYPVQCHTMLIHSQYLVCVTYLKWIFLLQCQAQVHRHAHKFREVQQCTLLSIKTGGCSEDCSYCPQSSRYKTQVAAQKLLSADVVLEAAQKVKISSKCKMEELFLRLEYEKFALLQVDNWNFYDGYFSIFDRRKKLEAQGFAWALHGEIQLVERQISIKF